MNKGYFARGTWPPIVPQRPFEPASSARYARLPPVRSGSGTADARSLSYSHFTTKGDHIMPYLLGWLLGVPLIVLVILYLIFH
ncbi:hypothetical protein CIC12_26895 [Burkholderia sp. SG-MS1]|nr:hypothetical protein [Paraburkholderia sp. SG-MS1]